MSKEYWPGCTVDAGNELHYRDHFYADHRTDAISRRNGDRTGTSLHARNQNIAVYYPGGRDCLIRCSYRKGFIFRVFGENCHRDRFRVPGGQIQLVAG